VSDQSGRTVLILAGGAGTRLWPLSTDTNPKQFLQIFGGKSLLQMTWDRLVGFGGAEATFVSTNERYAARVAEQLPHIPRSNILVEPARRNTAPAIATCCAVISRRFEDPVIGIFPSDHYIGIETVFRASVEQGYSYAQANEALVTVGITPNEPSSGFGYLELGGDLAPGVVSVKRFIEKPDRLTAERLLATENHVWNGGMFIWRSGVFFRKLHQAAPEIAAASSMFAAAESDEEARRIYEAMPAISIDYALMEKISGVAAVRGEFDWSDVGSWSAVAARLAGEPTTEVFLEEAEGSFVHRRDDRPIAIVGLKNVAVVDSPDGLLVLNLDKAELLSTLVKKILN